MDADNSLLWRKRRALGKRAWADSLPRDNLELRREKFKAGQTVDCGFRIFIQVGCRYWTFDYNNSMH